MMRGQWHFFSGIILFAVLLSPTVALAQVPPPSDDGFDPHRLVSFNFTNRDIADVIRHVVQLTDWSIFYDPAQVHGKVTIMTPEKIPLEQALRLIQGVMHPYGDAIQVLTADRVQPVPLAAALAEMAPISESPHETVWRNSNARRSESRPPPCDQQSSAHPLPPYGIDVIVDPKR